MPDEEILKEKPETLEDISPSLLSEEWIPLIEASRILGLKSIRQVYRRIKKHDIKHKLIVTGTRVRSYVRRDDVEKSKKLAWEEIQMSDMLSDVSDETSVGRPNDVMPDVIRNVIPQLKEFISSVNNKLDKIEDVRHHVTDLVGLIKEEMGERRQEREELRHEREERRKEREATIKAKEQERRANLVRMIGYLIVSLAFCGFVGYMTWKMYTGELFPW